MSQLPNYGEIRYNGRHDKWVVDKLPPHVSLRFKSLFPRVSEGRLPPFTERPQKAPSELGGG